MKSEFKVSVVVPVYNSEKYIESCLDSLVNQTLKNIEIICVNDGSPDNSINILRKYESKYKNIVIIDKQNEGVWKARLDGINKARGKYISFLDSDDNVEKDFLEKMYNKIESTSADISVCGFKRIDAKSKKVLSKEMKYSSDRIIDMNKNPEEVISVNTALWNKIYKATVLKELNDIENPPRILEDMMFLSIVYLKAQKITFVEEYLYNYMVIEGSAMNTLKENDIKSIENSMLEVKKIYIKNNASCEKMEILSSIAFLHLGISLILRIFQNEKEKFNVEYSNILKYLDDNFSQWRKTKYLNLIYNIKNRFVNGKVAIVKKMYVLHLMKPFLNVYQFITSVLKIDIKW